MTVNDAKGTILIVDDMPQNLRLLSNILMQHGYAVRAVTSGPMALKSVQAEVPDIVVLDISMPGMNGYEVCRAFKHDEQMVNVPVIFISAMDEVEDKVEAFQAGGIDYISKPFQVEEVLARIENQLSLQRTREELRRSEERFRLLAENARDIVFRFRLKPWRGFEYISPSVEMVTGYTADACYADPDIHLKGVYAEGRPLLQNLRRILSYREPIMLRYRHKRGHTLWLEQHHWPVYNAANRLIAVEGIVRDVTERKRAEAQQLQQHQAMTILRERDRLARELHDNLGQVLGYVNTQTQAAREFLANGQTGMVDYCLSNLILVAQDTHADIREFILGVTVDIASERGFFATLEHYLQRFSEISTIETRLVVTEALHDVVFLPTVAVHLLRIIQEALTNVRKHSGASLVRVMFEVAEPSPPAPTMSDPPAPEPNEGVWERALRDLAEQTTTSERNRSDREPWICLVIEDTGSGFVRAQQPVSGDQGYGLHSMHDRVSEIGGRLQVDSAPGAGTRVIVHMPLRRPETTFEQSLRVMIADDHPLFLEGIRSMLIARGMVVVGTATDGLQAIEQARMLRPDVILMDIEMPYCTGLEALRQIKQEQPGVQVVMLTVSAEDDYLFEAMRSGASGYLLKGLDADDFFSLLAGLKHGEVALSPGLASRILREFVVQDTTTEGGGDQKSRDAYGLSSRQREILQLVAQGCTYKQVGATLNLSERTIKHYMGEIVKLLHVRNRAEAVAYARRIGLSP